MSDEVEDKGVEAPVADAHLAMSDEDFLKAPAPEAKPVVEPKAAATEVVEPKVEAEDDKNDEDEGEGAESVADDGAADQAGDESADDEGDELGENKVKPTKAEVKVEKEVKEEAKVKAEAVNFESEYNKLLAPFKANGRDIAVKDVDEAITLMQMGANYNKKMAALKPNLKLLKLLENNGLLDESKLSFLIDLDKKNPDAINKLVKDSGLNPMDLDGDKAGAYKQTTYTVDEREVELDTVLEDLQGTTAYTKTLDIVSNKWDTTSRQTIAGSPQLLKVINDHVERGIYDLISTEVERSRMLGKLNGLSDIEAYRQVGDSIQARGGFNHLTQGSSQSQGKPTAKPVIVTPKPKPAEDDKLKDKRRAASSTKPAAPSGVKSKDYNPLALSDEEFMKQVHSQFL